MMTGSVIVSIAYAWLDWPVEEPEDFCWRAPAGLCALVLSDTMMKTHDCDRRLVIFINGYVLAFNFLSNSHDFDSTWRVICSC